jgi:Tfp pilus assembly protein PilE
MGGRQRGLGLIALIAVLAIIAALALFAMKIVPSYIEFRAAKNAIDAIAREKQGASVIDIRRAFENRQAIDDINALKATDLEISKEGNAVVISFAYRKEVQLFPNVGLYIDYTARAGGQ